MLIRDDFVGVRSPGTVIGTVSESASELGAGLEQARQGIDAEKTLSIDNNALRISPLITPGWNRSGIAYGPFQRQAGLALSVFMLNGHNASEGNSIEETLKGRFFRWLRGSETHSIPYRLKRWATSRHHRHRIWHFYRWLRNHKHRFEKDKHIKENLSIGWFSSPTPADPTQGNAITIRSIGAENGELCAIVDSGRSPALRGLQNLQTYYIVVLRERGAAYYAATLPNAKGLSAYPHMRLVGIDTQSAEQNVYAGVHQVALGQVGFRVDSRVYGVRADVVPVLAKWYGTAHMADSLLSDNAMALDTAQAEVGGVWRSHEGSHQKTPQGLIGTSDRNLSIIHTSEPIGALHIVIDAERTVSECAILWRTKDSQNTWTLFLNERHCELRICERGEWTVVATDRVGLNLNAQAAVQILDTGESFSLYLCGELLFGQYFSEERLRDECGIGLFSDGDRSLRFHHIEAHPRNILIPDELRMAAPWERKGSQVVISERFGGVSQTALEAMTNDRGQRAWTRSLGNGHMLLTGKGAVRVDASPKQPNPGRLVYTLPWSHPDFADVSVDILSPGKQRHEGEKGRGGLIFWQDADNYMIVNHWLDDTFDGAAMSVFVTVNGYEEIYDGVWANLGNRIVWGQKKMHRVVFDGLNFVVYVESEPVLCRSLRDMYPKMSPLNINRVGIVANWEWGNDTGSEFSNFVALF